MVDDDSSRRKENNIVKDNSPTKIVRRQSKFVNNRRSTSFAGQQRAALSTQRTSVQNSPMKLDPSFIDTSLDLQGSKLNMTLAQVHQKSLEEKRVLLNVIDYYLCQKKEQAAKKRNLLRLFEVTDVDVIKFDINSPSSEAMKNSLQVIGNPKAEFKVKPGKLTEFGKVTFSKYVLPFIQIICKKIPVAPIYPQQYHRGEETLCKGWPLFYCLWSQSHDSWR